MTNISLSYSTAVLQRSGPTASRSYSAAILQRSGPTAQRSYSVAVLQRSGLSFKIGRKVTKNIRHTQIYLHISPKTRNYCPFRIILRPLLRRWMPAHPLTAQWSYSIAVLQRSGPTASRSYSIAVLQRSGPTASRSYSAAVLQRSGPTASRSYSIAVLQRSGPTASRSYSAAVLQYRGHFSFFHRMPIVCSSYAHRMLIVCFTRRGRDGKAKQPRNLISNAHL